jgi:4-hydroxybenzoate polyprenyltransferase
MGLTALCAFCGARLIDFDKPVAVLLLLLLIWAALETRGILSRPDPGRGRRIELVSGVWTLVMYLNLGALPLALRAMGGAG